MEIIPGKSGVYILDRFWHFFLVPQGKGIPYLLERLNDEEIREGVIVCLELKYPKKSFAYFGSHVSLYKYMIKIPDDYRCFFEVINGNQKPHFDIDISEPQIPPGREIGAFGKELTDEVIRRIKKEFVKMKVKVSEEQILVFGSDGLDSRGKQKFSRHIIIDGVCHSNNKNASKFRDNVVFGLRWAKFIDSSVYKKNQQFRIVGCHKFGSDRVKEPQNHDIPEEDRLAQRYLYRTLVGRCADCDILPDLVEAYGTKITSEDPLNDLPEEAIEEAIEKLEVHFPSGIPYKLGKVEGSKVNLLRTMSSVCPICKYTLKEGPHTSDNAFIQVNNGVMMFVCWRAILSKQSPPYLQLGTLSTKTQEVIEEIQNEAEGEAGILFMGDLQIDAEGKLIEKKEPEIEPEESKISIADQIKALRNEYSQHKEKIQSKKKKSRSHKERITF